MKKVTIGLAAMFFVAHVGKADASHSSFKISPEEAIEIAYRYVSTTQKPPYLNEEKVTHVLETHANALPESAYFIWIGGPDTRGYWERNCDDYSFGVAVSAVSGSIISGIDLPNKPNLRKTYRNWDCSYDNGIGGGA